MMDSKLALFILARLHEYFEFSEDEKAAMIVGMDAIKELMRQAAEPSKFLVPVERIDALEQRVESMAVAHNGLARELRQARDVILQRLDMHVVRLDKLEGK